MNFQLAQVALRGCGQHVVTHYGQSNGEMQQQLVVVRVTCARRFTVPIHPIHLIHPIQLDSLMRWNMDTLGRR
eukprot:148906-Prorocentrum_minimum.AAC.1